MSELSLSRERDGDTFVLHENDVAVLSLPENPTTGFRWTADTQGVDLVSDDYVPSSTPAAGAGGLRVMRFVARSAGAGVIRVALQRAWESGNASDSCVFYLQIT